MEGEINIAPTIIRQNVLDIRGAYAAYKLLILELSRCEVCLSFCLDLEHNDWWRKKLIPPSIHNCTAVYQSLQQCLMAKVRGLLDGGTDHVGGPTYLGGLGACYSY